MPGWPAKRNPAYLVRATHGAVATENVLCSNMGVDVLKNGGNAIDAAIASVLCTGVVNMFSSGIGGGGFMTVRFPPSTPGGSPEGWTVDFRETAPAAANATMFVHDPNSSRVGGLSVGVPGELRGLAEAHRRWGTLQWKTLVEPVARLAAGWRVGIELERRIALYESLMLGDPDWSSVFAPDGRLLREGELIRRTNLSQTLHTIAEHGAEAFYTGRILDALIAKINATGGVLTAADFADYKPIVQPALKGSFKGRTVYTSHAPTSGPALLHILNLQELFNDTVDENLRLHRFIETLKCDLSSARTKICDPAFANDSSLIDMIASKAFAKTVFPNITDDSTHTPEYYHPIYDIDIDHGTSHTSIVDASGLAVSVTSTVNLVFGSQVLDPITGVILNDEMDDFARPGGPNADGLWPSPYNYPAPGKRPLSSTTPTILEHEDGSFYLALGGSGGSKIFGSVAQVIMGADAILSSTSGDEWIDISKAVEAPRAHDQLYPLQVEMDSTFDLENVASLEARGHNVTVMDINRIAAVVQAVLAKDGRIFAASDSRKNGIAAGY
ncbi:gamma-glutamyltranspeptidase [Hysterangium stoloniferum]|nr:gamma-glutamyltranspeptidase [Hysterangium stoloniferum]